MKPTEVYQLRAANERAFVKLYEYAITLENQVEVLAQNLQTALQELQEMNIKLQEKEVVRIMEKADG